MWCAVVCGGVPWGEAVCGGEGWCVDVGVGGWVQVVACCRPVVCLFNDLRCTARVLDHGVATGEKVGRRHRRRERRIGLQKKRKKEEPTLL